MGLPHFAHRDHAKRFKCNTVDADLSESGEKQ
jgi:hypothetical protein